MPQGGVGLRSSGDVGLTKERIISRKARVRDAGYPPTERALPCASTIDLPIGHILNIRIHAFKF